MNLLQKVKHTFSNAAKGANRNGKLDHKDLTSLLLDTVPSPITYINRDYHYEYANKTYADLFGVTPGDIIGKNVKDVVGARAYSHIKPYMDKTMAGLHVHYEEEIPLKHGKRFIEAVYIPDFDKSGNVKGYIALINDITGKKEKEKALQESDVRFRELIESLPSAIYTCDAEGHITMYNKAAVELWGRKPEIGKDLWYGSWKIFQPDGITSIPPDECPMEITLKEGRAVTGKEIIIERPDGKKRNIQPSSIPIFDTTGKVTGSVNMLVDITERKKSEQKLASLAAIVHSSTDAIISKTLNGIITSWNEASERIFGYTADEMIGQSVTKLIPEDRLNEESKILERLKKNEIVEHFETKRITKDKKILDISLTISPVKDSNDNIIGASKIARDITEQKALYKALQESEERMRMAIQSTKLGTWEFFPLTGVFTLSNECRKIYDVPSDIDVDYKFFSEHIHPDDADFVQLAIQKAMDPSGDSSYDIQYRILRYSDKKPRWIRAQGKLYFTANKQPERFIGTILDITEEKTQEQVLKDNIELFTTMADNVPVMIWMSGDDKFCDFFNKTWLEFTGRTLEQESNEGWLQNVHSDDLQKCIDNYNKSFNSQTGFYTEYRLKRHDGKYRWIADNSVPRYDADGSFAGFISACMDIDEQQKFREKIIENELLLKTISSASPVGLWMTDTNGQTTFVNDTWIDWTGIPFEKQLGAGWVERIIEKDKTDTRSKFGECLLKREKFSTEFRIIRKDSKIQWCLTEGSPYNDINGEFAGYAGSVTDITELKKLEERKDDFIKMASHELKTPITSIKGYVQLLLNIYEELNEEKFQASRTTVKSSLNTIAKQVSKLTRLVSELLDLTRIESGKLELRKTEFDLTDLVEETVQDVRQTTSKHAIIIHSDFEGTIYADKDRIAQVLLNLLINAIKYSPNADNVEVYVEGNKKTVIIKVKDHGIGIDKKDYPRIFERFYRVEGKSEQTYPGFGIGLFIAREIVQRHNGTIFVDSKKNRGSVFTVTLPLNPRN
jgi:PAS domain S-box-containing protein